MATVFLAQDERLGRLVAVKRLHGETTEDVVRRFRREARLGAALNHPNVVAVYDITADDEEGVLIVMEFVEGPTLREEIAAGPLPPERTIGILRGVAAALDYAHENGVVHRDVKPANVLIRHDGAVKLADLGIATAAEHSKITRSGAVLGTAAYMPPERLDGQPGESAADVYALSAVAFEMLCGRKAYEGTTPLEVAHKVVNEPRPDVRECLAGAPEELAEALKRGLAWDPADRFATAGDLVAAIEAALPEAAARAAVLPVDEPRGESAAAAPAPTNGSTDGSSDGADAEPSTPARVLPPERQRTRPARTAASAAPAAAAAASTTSGPDRVAERSERRRPSAMLIAAVLTAIALIVLVGIAISGGGDEPTGEGGGDQAEEVSPSAPGESKGDSGDEGAAPGSSGEAPNQGRGNPGGGSAPGAEGGSGAAPAAGTPAAAVNDFYTRAARDDYKGAWKLATENAHAALGGFRSFSAGQSSLESITFPRLKTTKQSGDSATVSLRSEAVHSDRIDRCRGTIDLVRSGRGWKLDAFHIAGCDKSPRP